ncbi:hypothetical protein [Sporosarcina sp. P17b]|uniref:hypothetical protein n=1 Tax=Sporosarcina sp. P17b TaxID=2048260 RepID=UPI000C16B065|nr:hypothetical protein [Sporosarcina sp. P17b]PIC72400.1 hypothetical protein CSV76_15245 [Sporosarcina sp. P17b]
MNITITIDAPELVGAINNLATALGNTGLPLPTEAPVNTDKPATEKVETPAKVEEPVKETTLVEKAEEPVQEEAPTKKEEPGISLEVVRGKLSTFTAEGKANQVLVKEALTALGVKKLTDVDPADYENLLETVGLTV